jgi:2-methylcitrate dehydratase PrpD
MARALDIDNVLEKASLHVHASVVAAVLALAERRGSVTGKEFLTAIIVGSDVVARLGQSNKIPTAVSGMNSTYQYGTFGTAAACGRLLRLSESQLGHSLGIAYSMVAGNSQCLVEGAMTTRLGQGTAAYDGVLSALLAEGGMTGARKTLEGTFGYFNCYQRGQYKPEAVLDKLGERFEGTDVSIKRHACCMHAHTSIDAVLDLVRKHNLRAGDIRCIAIGLNRQGLNLIGLPLAEKQRPASVAAAQFSAPFIVATAILRGRVFIDAFSDNSISDPAILELAGRTAVDVDPDIDRDAPGRCSPAKVVVTTTGGARLEARLDAVKGHPSNPLSFGEIAEKFALCNEFALNRLSDRRVRDFTDAIARLEELKDVRELTNILAPETASGDSPRRTAYA